MTAVYFCTTSCRGAGHSAAGRPLQEPGHCGAGQGAQLGHNRHGPGLAVQSMHLVLHLLLQPLKMDHTKEMETHLKSLYIFERVQID